MKFWQAFFWEFVQNLPIVIGFAAALELWQKRQPLSALGVMLGGSTLGALTIRATESKIVAGHREPWRVVAVNILVMTTLMLAIIAYLQTGWSNWVTDIVGGIGAGIVLGIAQSLAAGEPIGLRHCLAFACAFPPALIGIRQLFATPLPLVVNILIITLGVTFIITLLDYGPLSFKKGG